MRQLFSLMLKLFVKNVDEEQVMRVNGDFVPIDPTSFNPEMDLVVNVGIGTGRQNERAAALQQTLAIQQQIYTAYGPMNGVVTLTQIRNTLADMLALGGIRNAERYYQPMTEEIEQQMLMMQQQQAQQQAMMQGSSQIQWQWQCKQNSLKHKQTHKLTWLKHKWIISTKCMN